MPASLQQAHDADYDAEKVRAADSPGATCADPASSDAVSDQVVVDHREILAIYRRFKLLYRGAGGGGTEVLRDMRRWANQFVWEVARHSVAEEIVMYPRLQHAVADDGGALAADARGAHARVQRLLADADRLLAVRDPAALDAAQLADLLDTAVAELKTHMRIEETLDLPRLNAAVSPADLHALGRRFRAVKAVGPTHPHPAVAPAPSPTLEALLGAAAAPLDRMRDALREFPSKEEVRDAVRAQGLVREE
ncbi:hypothetical protein HK405_001376 [Cladochytrium tenue]|nr:hypothetical protein HK405_001376 [Cladochytrium tenue]